MKKHCIVTPDFVGPITNGGIGTACLHLALFLREIGDEVDILFTGPCQLETNAYWSDYYKKRHGIGYYAALDMPTLPFQPIHEARWFMQRAMVVHKWLKTRDYNQIHFQDWQANGFAAMQARVTTGAYTHTLLTVCLHSSSEWQREGSMLFPEQGAEDMVLDFCERYCVEKADVAISPSAYMRTWAQCRDWHLPLDHRVVPYLIASEVSNQRRVTEVKELVFFGRLETRKGLEIFVQALEILAKEHPLPSVTFMGKFGMTVDGPAAEYLAKHLGPLKLTHDIIDHLDSSACIKLLREKKDAVVVIPSLQDNLPYTVYECCVAGIPFIASDVGGIPEIIKESNHLFRPTPKGLALRLSEVLQNGLIALPATNLPGLARDEWKAIQELSVPQSAASAARRDGEVSPSSITICVAHFNYGRYLPALIESLRNQTLQGFGLIVVDDGSTDEGSVRVFDDLAQRFGSETWIFLRKPNGGIGETRNFAAARASTEFLVFMDADNLAEPRMVERMAACMGIFGGDALTCHMRGFSDSTSKSPLEIIYSYMPPGPCLEAGYLANVFGDANCIVRRTAFQKVRGFNEDRRSSFEDWELLARLALQCFRLDVIPEYLFLYRHTEQGFSRNTSPYLNHRRVLDAYHEALPSWAGRLIMSAFATNMVLQRLGMNRPANQPVSSLPAGKEFRALGLRYLKRYPTKPWRYNGPKLILAMAWYVTNQRCPSLQQRLKVVI